MSASLPGDWSGMEALEPRLMLSGSLLFDLDGGEYAIVVNGNSVEFKHWDSEWVTLYSQTGDVVFAITINAQGGQDELSLDFSNGSPIPLVIKGTDGEQLTIGATNASSPVPILSLTSDGGSETLIFQSGSFVATSDLGLYQNATVELGADAELRFTAGQHLDSLSIGDGSTVVLSPGGGKVLVVGSLSIAQDETEAYLGTLDLCDNGLIVKSPSESSSLLDNITAMIKSARGDGTWRNLSGGLNTGITSSTMDPDYRSAGIGDRDHYGSGDLDQFMGEPLPRYAVVARATWGGDADLDGVVTSMDYSWIDYAYATNNPESGPPPEVPLGGWQNGDFNYDGVIDFMDYGFIDFGYSYSSSGNDEPENNVPSPQLVGRNSSKAWEDNEFSITDNETNGTFEVTLSVLHGTISLTNEGENLSFTVGDGVEDPVMTFTGSLGDINTALGSLTYAPKDDYVGPDTLTMGTAECDTGLFSADTVNIWVWGGKVLYWDPDANASNNNVTTGDELGGCGTWNEVDTVWYDPVSNSDIAWSNDYNAAAVFLGTEVDSPGPVTVDGSIVAFSVSFLTDGYSVEGDELSFAPGMWEVQVANGVAATVCSPIGGTSGLTKVGGGTLTLASGNTYTGITRIGAGTLVLGNSLALRRSVLDMNAGDDGTVGFGDLTEASLAGLEGSRYLALENDDSDPVALTVGSGEYSGVLSESGSLIKAGEGTLILSGLNTYAGGTTITDGVLAIGEDGQVGTGGIVFDGDWCDWDGDYLTSDSGTLRLIGKSLSLGQDITMSCDGAVDTNGGDLALSGTISGLFGLTKTGDGTLTLDGENTYSGDTRIGEGTLVLGDACSLQDSTLDMNEADSGTLSFGTLSAATLGGLAGSRNLSIGGVSLTVGGNGYSTTYSGVISGTGSLTKQGLGTLTLTGVNTYSGTTAVNGGTLVMNGGSSTGSIAIANNGALRFSQSDARTYGGVISGSGSVEVGSGTLTLTAENIYTGHTYISGGTLVVGSDSNLGDTAGGITFDGGTLHVTDTVSSSRSIELSGSGTIQVDQNKTLTLAGDISGTGSLTKEGSGTLVLAGVNSYYSGGTVIRGGILTISSNGNLGASTGGITFDGGTLQVTDTVSSSRSIELTGSGTIQIDQNKTLTLGGVKGSGNLTKIGGGDLTLGSLLVNSVRYSGQFIVYGGSLTAVSGFSDDRNQWDTMTIEALPGFDLTDPEHPQGTRVITFENDWAQVMLKGTVQVGTSNAWWEFTAYTDDGKVTLSASGPAVTGYDDSYADLLDLDLQTGNYEYLANDAGLITVTDYYDQTCSNISGTSSGGVAGNVQHTWIKQGETGTAILQSTTDYYEHHYQSYSHPVANYTVYPDENCSGTARTTHYSYTWYEDSDQISTETVCSTAVCSVHNGSNDPAVTTTVYDSSGRPIWAKDAGGFLTYTAYDSNDNVTKTITDVDTTQTDDFTDKPSGWSKPTGAGSHLIITYEVDGDGRTVKETDPNGNVTYTVYKDATENNPVTETRVYRGWDSGAPTGPTEVSRTDSAQHYSEFLTMTATPNLTDGRPDGTEAISGIQSLSRTYTDTEGNITAIREYFNLSTYSTDADLGTAGVNYYATTYAYDSSDNLVREEDPSGVITRTVYDSLGRETSTWVGTDDSVSDPNAPWSPSNMGTNSNMVKVSETHYDNQGDVDWTKSYADANTSYTTTYKYDWRGRMTDVRGPDNVAVRYTYDNLDETTLTETYADTNEDFVIDSGTLRAKTETLYDEQGRPYRTTVYEVNQSTGAVVGNGLAADFWYDARGYAIKTSDPSGLFSKTQYNGAGRIVASYTSSDANETDYDEADDVTGDTVLSQTIWYYDSLGRVWMTQAYQRTTGASGTGALTPDNASVRTDVSWFDDHSQVVWVATYDTDSAAGITAGGMDYDFDGNGSGDDYAYADMPAGNSDAYVLTQYGYDDWGRISQVTDDEGTTTQYSFDDEELTGSTILPDPDGAGPLEETKVVTTYDLLGRQTATQSYKHDGQTDTLLAQSEYSYDSAGNLSAARVYEVSGGSAGDYLQATYSYDSLGRMVKTTDPNGAFTKTVYNAYGTVLGTYVGTAEGSCSDPTNVTGDTIVSQTIPFYDSAGRVWMTRTYARYPDACGDGALTPSNARVTYDVAWFDDVGRVKWSATYGTNGGTPIEDQDYDFNGDGAGTGYGTPGTSGKADMTDRTSGNSDSYILTRYAYDGFGRNNSVTDNADRETRYFFDADGRTTYVVENYQNFGFDTSGNPINTGGGTNHDQDRVTEYVYNAAGLLTQQIALDSNGDGDTTTGDDQVTNYVYAMDLDSDHQGSPVPDGALLRAVSYPDGTSRSNVIAAIEGTCSATDFQGYTYNAAGLTATFRDQAGTVHEYSYDDLGRLTQDSATARGTGVDDTVQAITYAYDDAGRVSKVTSWACSDASGDVRNQILYSYDGWGDVVRAYQSHSGEVSVNNGTPYVGYEYADGADTQTHAAKYLRLTSVTYPDGRVVYYNYGTSGAIDDVLSRVNNIASSASPCSTDIFAQYAYLGDGTIVGVSHPAVSGGLNLTYGSPSDSCGGYAGLDRFGRVIDQKWQTDGCSPTVLDEYSYGYDLAGNRTYRQNVAACGLGLDELYSYDALGRLTGMERGTLTETNGQLDILCSTVTRGWTLDQLGNWQGLDTDGDTQPEQTRTHDAANQITTIDECSTGLGYDPAGNMTGDGTLTYKYDAWNRLTEADEGANVVATYRYDGLNRRVSKAVAVYVSGNLTGYDRTDYQYDEAWQVLEERFTANQCSAATVAEAPHAQYVWDIRYVDAPVLRLRDTAGPSCSQPDGDLDDSGDEVVYYTNDANMNVTALVNPDGEVVERYAYDAYGKPIVLNGAADADPNVTDWSADANNASDVGNEILYAGYRYEPETLEFQVRNREYSPSLGRWLQADPAGYVDGQNVYQYGSGLPTGQIDPEGLQSGYGGGQMRGWVPREAEGSILWTLATRRDTAPKDKKAIDDMWAKIVQIGKTKNVKLTQRFPGEQLPANALVACLTKEEVIESITYKRVKVTEQNFEEIYRRVGSMNMTWWIGDTVSLIEKITKVKTKVVDEDKYHIVLYIGHCLPKETVETVTRTDLKLPTQYTRYLAKGETVTTRPGMGPATAVTVPIPPEQHPTIGVVTCFAPKVLSGWAQAGWYTLPTKIKEDQKVYPPPEGGQKPEYNPDLIKYVNTLLDDTIKRITDLNKEPTCGTLGIRVDIIWGKE